ncbi:MAG: NfeD family protein [Woeseiaceae bacterium]
MSEILTSVIVAILVAVGVYELLEWREIFRASRDMPHKPVSGPEALVGRRAKVNGSFELTKNSRMLLGRVLIDGEMWNAELDRSVDDAPELGAELVVIAIDPSKLKVRVK